MPNLPALLHDSVLAVGVPYVATVTTTALAATFARTPRQRHDARTVLKILLRRRDR